MPSFPPTAPLLTDYLTATNMMGVPAGELRAAAPPTCCIIPESSLLSFPTLIWCSLGNLNSVPVLRAPQTCAPTACCVCEKNGLTLNNWLILLPPVEMSSSGGQALLLWRVQEFPRWSCHHLHCDRPDIGCAQSPCNMVTNCQSGE